MEIKGFKTFDKDMRDCLGNKFEEGEIYSSGGSSKGIHFCKRLEDSLRGYDALENDVIVAKVSSLGKVIQDEDEIYDYYDMYYTDLISIDKVLSRAEIILMYLRMEPNARIKRFLSSFKLTEEEVALFRALINNAEYPDPNIVRDIDNTISYYQEGNTKVFEEEIQKQKLKTM